MKPSPVLLTEPEAAEALRVCARTLRKARSEGKLTYVLIGRAVRYTMDDLEAFVDASKQDAPPMPKPKTNRKRIAAGGRVVPFTARQK